MEYSSRRARTSIEVYLVIENERKRQKRIEQGMARTEVRTGCETNEAQPPGPLSETNVESLYPLISLHLRTRTPRERFCVVDLVDDCDAIYGRMLWSNDDNNPTESQNRNKTNSQVSSVHQRQRHADQLAMRFVQNKSWNDWQQIQSSGATCDPRLFSNESEESGEIQGARKNTVESYSEEVKPVTATSNW